MEIVENSYYEHEQHGTVKILDVTDDTVSFEKMNDYVRVNGKYILSATKESVDGFQQYAEPADITVSATAAVFDLTGKNQ